MYSVNLEPGEYITKVTGNGRSRRTKSALVDLILHTNRGRTHGPYGSNPPKGSWFEASGHRLLWIAGLAEDYVHQIQFGFEC